MSLNLNFLVLDLSFYYEEFVVIEVGDYFISEIFFTRL